MTTEQKLACFKAYDIRGRVPEELNPEVAEAIGRAYAAVVQPQGPVAIGWDIRLSSPELAQALTRGLNASGVDTQTLGQCGTEMIYHAASQSGMGGGIMVTASHNPMDYNGMKLVRDQAIPLSGDSGLPEMERRVRENDLPPPTVHPGTNTAVDVLHSYVQRILGFIEVPQLKPLHLVVNAGNGAAGPVFDALAEHLPFRITRVHHEPDGHFPNGIPNPLLPENRSATAEAVQQHGADMGIAWDGDFDRCFFFDERGAFIEGYYMVGLLAAQILAKHPGGRVIHDTRLTWNTRDMARQAGGVPIMGRTGHAFMKDLMRSDDALYAGEMSAHHYFRDFACCDSGMIPWLLIAEAMSVTGQPLSALVEARISAYPCSGEINFPVRDVAAAIGHIADHYAQLRPMIDTTDGISMDFDLWRFNLRGSNTEPMLRLNVESRGDAALMQQRTQEISDLIAAFAQ
ncbi:phosphomannomutase [Ectothiorhodosinus mongolicus]|uniref:phosphomannomutase n=1 Tax=Ectothiorhodosinus mongolicus TaxID=233100 RepID=A0A1R3W646_9GAMM|nr:phosphomannomutase [Ectothiorhodosinus mongolicus]ULX57613.1 phosphomannomutase [Ectothiorhodosinus mongolicus]SIT73103.1 phosphomannomutase [Ectothiorhodosinus mongolicus]